MIELVEVTHRYGEQLALDALSMRIEPQDTFAFIGPNGAGKTTTIRILATLLEPSEGEAYVAGISVREEPEKVRQAIGFMPDQFGLYDGLKVWEYLDLFAELHGFGSARRQRLIADVLELTDLGARREAFTEHLSKGMRQRLCLARTLLHDPQVLILDEPASGLDPRARSELKELLRELRRMGKTILVSSHILPELADFCTRVGILEEGRLVAFGTLDEVLHRAASEGYQLRVLGSAQKASELLLAAGAEELETLEDGLFSFRLGGGPQAAAALLKTLALEDLEPCELVPIRTDLESAYLTLTRGGASE